MNGKEKEMDKKDYMNVQGRCPKCHGYNLDYQPIDYADDMCFYRYTCDDCGQQGEEWYSMQFAGHNIATEDDDWIEL